MAGSPRSEWSLTFHPQLLSLCAHIHPGHTTAFLNSLLFPEQILCLPNNVISPSSAWVRCLSPAWCPTNKIDSNFNTLGLPCWLRWSRIHLQCRRPGFNPWVGKTPWRREWLPTPVFLPRESHGQRGLASYHPFGHRVRQNWATNTHFTFTSIHFEPWKVWKSASQILCKS